MSNHTIRLVDNGDDQAQFAVELFLTTGTASFIGPEQNMRAIVELLSFVLDQVDAPYMFSPVSPLMGESDLSDLYDYIDYAEQDEEEEWS